MLIGSPVYRHQTVTIYTPKEAHSPIFEIGGIGAPITTPQVGHLIYFIYFIIITLFI